MLRSQGSRLLHLVSGVGSVRAAATSIPSSVPWLADSTELYSTGSEGHAVPGPEADGLTQPSMPAAPALQQASWFTHTKSSASHSFHQNSIRRFSSSGQGPSQGGPPEGTGSEEASPGQVRMSLQQALMRLVDAAVEMVEAGRSDEAVSVLKEGIATFEPNFPDSPEVGELHNQVALLSLVGGDADTAAQHAARALAITQKHFAASGPLVGHRQLRLGVSQFVQGRLTDAASMLHGALEALSNANDPSRHEAQYYLTLSLLAGTRDVGQVAQMEERLLNDIRHMKETFGPESMIVSLALSQHDRIAHQPLSATEPDQLLCETLLKQHTKLLKSVNPESEDVAMAHYKLATFYYVNDMLPDAHSNVRESVTRLRATLPEDHDLVALCKHRMGMICAVSGDHRSAEKLLEESRQRFDAMSTGAASGAVTGLSREAALGLAIAKYKRLSSGGDAAAKKDALAHVRSLLDELAAAIGINHMLARGAMRHFAQMNVMSKAYDCS